MVEAFSSGNQLTKTAAVGALLRMLSHDQLLLTAFEKNPFTLSADFLSIPPSREASFIFRMFSASQPQ